MNDLLNKILKYTAGKNVCIATHWDADGVSSGAIIYHLIKDKAAKIRLVSKGETFLIEEKDIPNESEIVIVTDIQVSDKIKLPVIYFDHHPAGTGKVKQELLKKEYFIGVCLDEIQSTSLLLWEKLIKDSPYKNNAYLNFLVLLGYFGDGGTKENIPNELYESALELFPELMIERTGYNKSYLEIESYVSMLNVGKRMHWNGILPLSLLTSVDDYYPIVNKTHPLVKEIYKIKSQLRDLYNMKINIEQTGQLDIGIIECKKNIQGVLCARYMRNKPIIIINKHNGKCIASLRVPDNSNFDAGVFLNKIMDKIPNMVGGGHEKAGGCTFPSQYQDSFIKLLKQIS